MAEQIKILFELGAPGAHGTLCVLIPHRQGEGDLLLNAGTPSVPETAEATDLKFCMHIQGVA